MSRVVSKLMAIGLLATFAAGVWFAVSVPITQWRDKTIQRHAQAKEEFGRLSIARERLEYQRDQAEVVDGIEGLWTAAQTGEAFARVQGALAKSAAQNGISFRAMTPLPASARDGVTSAVVRIEFEADVAQLTGFLRNIEYVTPALPVDRAVLRRLVRPNDTSRMPVLFTQIDIAAPLLVEGGAE